MRTFIKNTIIMFIFLIPLLGKIIDLNELIILSTTSLLIFTTAFFVSKGKLSIPPRLLFWELILLTLLLTSTLLSQNIGSSYYQFFCYLSVFLLINSVLYGFDQKNFLRYFIYFCIPYSIWFLFIKLSNLPFYLSYTDDLFNINWGHSYLSDILIFSVPIILDSIRTKRPIFHILLLFLFTLTLILTNSRSAILALLLGLLLYKSENFGQKLTRISLILVLILGLGSILFLTAKSAIPNKTFDGSRPLYWQQSVKGFLSAPVFGNGPDTFRFINKKYNQQTSINSYSSHNSLLTGLSEMGIIFTGIFFLLIIKALAFSYKTNHLFFICGLIALTNSLFDSTWNSIGILLISLIFIFYPVFNAKIAGPGFRFFNILISTILFIFTLSISISYLLYRNNDYQRSIAINPFNLSARLAMFDQSFNSNRQMYQNNIKQTVKLFPQDTTIYINLIETIPFEQGEQFYLKLIELDPKNCTNYIKLISQYQNRAPEKLKNLIDQFDKNFTPDNFPSVCAIPFTRAAYHQALTEFPVNNLDALRYFSMSARFMPNLSYYQIELANAYWYSSQKDKALKQLEICQSLVQPESHCRQYQESHMNKKFSYPGDPQFINYIDHEPAN